MTSPPLFDFKAGRVEYNDSTGEAKPLAGQGRVTLIRSSEDPSLLGMQWLPRGSNNNAPGSEELLLIPGDVEFTHVSQCQTGRVIQMKFNSSGERHFFWLQDAPKGDLHELSESDKTILEKLNELANSTDIDEEEEDGDPMQDVKSGSPETQESFPKIQLKEATDDSGALPRSTLHSLLSNYIGEHNRSYPHKPLSEVVSQAERVKHVQECNDQQIRNLLKTAQGIATSREDLNEIVTSPYFSQCLDELGNAILQSSALAREFGLKRIPSNLQEFMESFKTK